MKKMKSIQIVIVLVTLFLFFQSQKLNAQSILYSEDFSNTSLENKGQNGTTFDLSGVSNWTIDVSGGVVSSNQYFKQSNGLFQSNNTDATQANGVLWYSLEVDISCYTNVSVSTTLSRQSNSSSSGVEAFYILNGGSPISFGSLIGSASSPINVSKSGLSGNKIKILIKHWGTSSTPVYQHDNVLITGNYSTSICPIPAVAPSCGGYLTDSDAGTSVGNYINNINYLSRICPTNPGELTTVKFEDLDIGVGDVLKIYEGDNINGNLLGTVNSSTTSGYTISSYDCITFNWLTDGNDTGNKGFWASISCSKINNKTVASDNFEDAPTICDLSSYSGSTNGNTSDIPFNLKPNGNSTNAIECDLATFKGSIDNNSWLKFVATSNSVSMNVVPGSCVTGFDGGIQMAILSFNGSSFTRLSECSLTSGGQSNPFTISASSLTIGETYYIMVDGNAGSKCDYKINMTSGFTPLSATASPETVCAGSSVTLTSIGGINSNLIWFADDPSFGSDYGSTINTTPSKTTTYTVLSKGDCAGKTANIQVIVNNCGCTPPANPTADLTHPTCANNKGTIEVTNPVTSGNTFSIDGTNFNTTTSFGNLAPGSYTITVKNASGCTSTANFTINTVPVQANLIINTPAAVCEPNTINLLNPSITAGSTDVGSMIYFYSDPLFTTLISNPAAYNIIGTTTVYAKTTNSSNCSDSKPVVITINPKDNITITSNINKLCSNDPLAYLKATPINGIWSGIGIKPNGAIQPSQLIVGQNEFTYTSSGICPNSKIILVDIFKKPSLVISKKDTICEGEEIKLQDISPFSNITKCIWEFGDNVYSYDLNETKHKYYKSGYYDITFIGTDQNGCTDTLVEKDFIYVLEKPIANFSVNPNKPTIFNNTIQTTNLSMNATNYRWDFGDEAESGLTNPTHKYTSTPNIYFITLKAYNQIASCVHDTTMQIEVFDEIYCYIPNTFTPNGDELNNEFKPILSGSVAEENYSLYIYNRWGELLFESHNKNVGWNGAFGNKICIPGTYIWKIEYKDNINKEKHMKTGHVNLIQ